MPGYYSLYALAGAKRFLLLFLLGASASFQLNQFEEAITWCEKGLAVSFTTDASMEKICHIQTLHKSFVLAFVCVLSKCNSHYKNFF